MPSAEPDAGAAPRRDSEQFAGQVQGMFDRIAGVYDLMNSAMTAGLHHRWRERAVERAGVGPGSDALDLCCGTGDLTLALRRRIGPDGRVVGSDFSEPMLEIARAKSGEQGLPAEFAWADALELPYGDASFDAVTIGFGAHNLADLLASFYSVWFDRLVPLLGSVAGDSDAYSYLPESVLSFPGPEELAARMDAAGFERVRWLLLAGGIIAIHSGVKPA